MDFTTAELNRYFYEGRIDAPMAEEEEMTEDTVEVRGYFFDRS